MKQPKAFPIVILALILTLVFQGVGSASAFPEIIQLPVGWQAEGITVGRGHTFYAGSLATGAVWRGDLRTGEGGILVPPLGAPTVGLSFDNRSGYLFAAGGPMGTGYVFDGETGATLAVFNFTDPSGTFINDVIVTRDAAYFTNSSRAEYYRVPLGPGGRLPDPLTFETIALTGDWVQQPGFNANGIEATPNGKWLLIIQSNTGILYRVEASTGEAVAVDLGGYSLTMGDGIALRGHTLYVERNSINLIAVVELNADFTAGEVVDEITHPAFGVPTTVAIFGNALYAVNAHFGAPDPSTQTYEVVRVERR